MRREFDDFDYEDILEAPFDRRINRMPSRRRARKSDERNRKGLSKRERWTDYDPNESDAYYQYEEWVDGRY